MKNFKREIFNLVALNIFIITFFYSAMECDAQSASHKLLLALSKSDHTLAIVDPVTFNVIARIPVGIDPMK